MWSAGRWSSAVRRASPSATARSGWPTTARDDQVVRIDPKTLAIAERFHVGGNVSAVTYGFGSVWAALQTGQVVRITPEHRR